MNNNLLNDRLKRLKKDTFFRFVLFLHSPYFHKNQNAIQLIEILKPYYPDFILPKNAKDKIEKLTPSKTAYNVLLSRMNDLLDEFEHFEMYNSKGFIKKSLKYELELEQKNNLKYYNQLKQNPDDNSSDSDESYAEFYKEFASIALCENNWLMEKEKIFYHSDRAMKNMLHFFLNKYLMVYANKITHSINVPEEQPELTETSTILNFVEENLKEQPISVQCLFYIIQLYKNISHQNSVFDYYYEQLKKNTFHLASNEISYEIKYVLLQASSACVIKCYTEPAYFRNAFEIMQLLLQKELYFSDQHDLIVQQRFILVVKIALGANQIDWAKDFISNESGRISKKQQTNLCNYALGLIYFQQQRYNEAVKLMVKIKMNTPQFIADYKITLLKMYYELDDNTGFNYQSQTFLKFLSKDKSLNKPYKKNIIDSIEFIKLIFKYRKNGKNAEFSKKLQMKNLNYLISNYRDKWYLEKSQSLTDKKKNPVK